ncbi:MAG: nickel-binding protein [Acidimicrobiales bacterium]
MPEYLVETYVSRTAPSGGVPRAADVSAAAEQLTREGRPVRLVRSIAVPEEEICYFLFRARTADAVREVATRAGLRFGRVVEALPEWVASPDASRTARSKASDTHKKPTSKGESS